MIRCKAWGQDDMHSSKPQFNASAIRNDRRAEYIAWVFFLKQKKTLEWLFSSPKKYKFKMERKSIYFRQIKLHLYTFLQTPMKYKLWSFIPVFNNYKSSLQLLLKTCIMNLWQDLNEYLIRYMKIFIQIECLLCFRHHTGPLQTLHFVLVHNLKRSRDSTNIKPEAQRNWII